MINSHSQINEHINEHINNGSIRIIDDISKVYYDGFTPPPPGAVFSQEWGFQDGVLGTSPPKRRHNRFRDVFKCGIKDDSAQRTRM